MRTSIWLRVVLLVNVLILGAAALIAWVSADVAGRVIEDNLFREMVRNTGTFLRDRRLPPSDTMMAGLARMYGVQAAAVERDTGKPLGSSFTPERAGEFSRVIASAGAGESLTLGGESFRMDSSDLSAPGEAAVRLYLLVPQARLQQARDQALRRILVLAVPAVAVTTLLASVLALTVTRPIRKLAGRMDQFGTAGEDASDRQQAELLRTLPRRGPSEVMRLVDSFRRLLERLRTAQAGLEQAARLAALGRLSASVAHELRNPLSGIKMNVRVLQDQFASAGLSDQAFNPIYREIERMDLYLQELMGLATGSSLPPRPGQPQEAVLAALADSAATLLAGRCSHENVRVHRDYQPAPPVQAPPDRVRQVIVNLMINALDAMPRGGAMTVAIGPANGGARLSVADTGGGVRAPEGRDIFEPFVTTKDGGAGLGLHICRQIVRDCGGQIGYDSTPAGATFWFELPAACGKADATP